MSFIVSDVFLNILASFEKFQLKIFNRNRLPLIFFSLLVALVLIGINHLFVQTELCLMHLFVSSFPNTVLFLIVALLMSEQPWCRGRNINVY